MKRRRIVMVALALMLGLTGVIAYAAPSRAGTGFSFESLIDINTVQRCIGQTDGLGTANTCTYENGQLFYYGSEKGTSGYYQLVNSLGTCMGVWGGSDSAGARIEFITCDTTHPAQFWALHYDPSSECYLLFNYNSGYVIQVNGTEPGAPLTQEPWVSGYIAQLWSIQAQSP